MFACDGSVTTVDACAVVKRAPAPASRSSHGVATWRLPYEPSASARSVSMVMSRTFCVRSRRIAGDREQADSRTAARSRKQASLARTNWLARDRADSVRDVVRGNAEALEQFIRLPAAGNLAHRQALDGEARPRHRFGDRVAQAAHRIVIFDGDEMPARRAAGGDE